jgi:uncharacterized FlgJ-related protein
MKKLITILLLLQLNFAVGQVNYDKVIFNTALKQGADSITSRIIVAQARHESGDFKNVLTRNHNNVFGMQHPRVRRTTSIGAYGDAEKKKNIYASYRSIEDAVIDLFLYLDARNISKRQHSIPKYVRSIKAKKYFKGSETEYVKNMRRKFKQVKL